MAGEFTKRVENQQNIWTCTNCSQEIVNVSKPRGHVCGSGSNSVPPNPPPVTTPSSPSQTPRRPPQPSSLPNPSQRLFQQQPQDYSVPPPQSQIDLSALYHAQRFQAEQHKQGMIMMQQQR